MLYFVCVLFLILYLRYAAASNGTNGGAHKSTEAVRVLALDSDSSDNNNGPKVEAMLPCEICSRSCTFVCACMCICMFMSVRIFFVHCRNVFILSFFTY